MKTLNNKGFTLIEVLVALIIFSFSMATIYWGFSQGIKNTKKAIELIHSFNLVNNFFILNKKNLIEDERENFINKDFIIEKYPLSVTINDNFKIENENIYILKIKDKKTNNEFKYILSK